jgi:hypothetical protein
VFTATAMMTAAETVRPASRTFTSVAVTRDRGGVDPQARPRALERPLQEGVDPLVDLLAQPRDLGFADAGHAHRLHPWERRSQASTLRVETPCTSLISFAAQPWITAASAFSAVRRGSRKPGKDEPFRS